LSLVESNDMVMPIRWAESIDAAGCLIESIRNGCLLDEALRRNLLSTLRHYPEYWLRRSWCEPNLVFPIRFWLLPEDDLDM